MSEDSSFGILLRGSSIRVCLVFLNHWCCGLVNTTYLTGWCDLTLMQPWIKVMCIVNVFLCYNKRTWMIYFIEKKLVLSSLNAIMIRGIFGQTSRMKRFAKKVNSFLYSAPSLMFDRVLNTLLIIMTNSNKTTRKYVHNSFNFSKENITKSQACLSWSMSKINLKCNCL